jgi:universal stress protein E
MRSIRRILVAVKDPKAKALPAVAKAAQLAKAFGAELELFHSLSSTLYVDAFALTTSLPDLERTTLNDSASQLEQLASSLRMDRLKVSVSVQWDYPVYEAVIRRAREIQADLIVAERHPGRHVAPGLLHLTDWELLRLSPMPVLLVKKAGTYEKPVMLAALDPEHAFAKPVGLDAEILTLSSLFTDALHGTQHAVHAYIPIGAMPKASVTVDTVAQVAAQAEAQAQQRLDRVLLESDIPRTNRHIVPRHPIDAIEDVAREIRSDVVVMGAIARSGLKRLVIGNTAEAVLDALTCDLLIVKPPGFTTDLQAEARGLRCAVSAMTQVPY